MTIDERKLEDLCHAYMSISSPLRGYLKDEDMQECHKEQKEIIIEMKKLLFDKSLGYTIKLNGEEWIRIK